MQTVKHICLTGGPCGGKTTALAYLSQKLTDRGWRVLIIPEVATWMIGGGLGDLPVLAQTNPPAFVAAETAMMALQRSQYLEYQRLAEQLPDQKVVCIYDRGMSDCKAYLSPRDFQAIVADRGWSLVELGEGFDGVFHLVTAASGAEAFYTLDNNTSRTETPAQARAADARTQQAWVGHSHLRVIDNSTDFAGKLHRLLANVCGVLGEPVPLEIERKYLVGTLPNLSRPELAGAVRVQIEQTYLVADDGAESRVRCRTWGGLVAYFQTIKHQVSATTRFETERLLSYPEYLSLLTQADPRRQTVIKDRWCFLWRRQYFELDLFTQPALPYALLEIELTEEGDRIYLPPFLKIDREVTDDPAFHNSALALRT